VRKRRSFQIGPATPGEVSGTKKRDIFLEKNPVKTVENFIFHWGRPASGAMGPAGLGRMRGAGIALENGCCRSTGPGYLN